MGKYHLYWLKKQGTFSRDCNTHVLHPAQRLSISKTKQEMISAAPLCRGLCSGIPRPTWSFLISTGQGLTPFLAPHAMIQSHLPLHGISH